MFPWTHVRWNNLSILHSRFTVRLLSTANQKEVELIVRFGLTVTFDDMDSVIPWKPKNGITSLEMPKIKIWKNTVRTQMLQADFIKIVKSTWSILTAFLSHFDLRHMERRYPIFRFSKEIHQVLSIFWVFFLVALWIFWCDQKSRTASSYRICSSKDKFDKMVDDFFIIFFFIFFWGPIFMNDFTLALAFHIVPDNYYNPNLERSFWRGLGPYGPISAHLLLLI